MGGGRWVEPQKGKKANFKKERSNKKEKGRGKKSLCHRLGCGSDWFPPRHCCRRAPSPAVGDAVTGGGVEVEALLGGEQSFVWSAAAVAAGLRKRRGRERGDRALEAELRAWKSLGGPGDSALRLACLFTCAANSPRALHALPGADP